MDVKNTYWLLRHGHSLANAQDIIVSRLEEGMDPKWGLSDLGRQQADAAGETLIAHLLGHFNPAQFLVYTSPFSRCIETAARAASHLDIHLHDPRMIRAPDLRERFFGTYELASTSNYHLVWAVDARSTGEKPPGDGESVEEVASRLKGFIDGIEAKHAGHDVLLVSHGDALSILAALMLGKDLAQHRQFGLDNCGIMRIPEKTE